MNLTVETAHLRGALDRLSGLPGSNNDLLVSQLIRLEASLMGLVLTRYSHEAKLAITLDEAAITEEGEPIMVSYRTLNDVVGRLPGKEIVLTTRDERFLKFVSGKAEGRLPIFDPEEAPPVPEMDMEIETVDLPIDNLRANFRYSSLATYRDSSRPNLCGVAIQMLDDNGLAFVGTDGRRGHISSEDRVADIDCIVPNQCVDVILRMLAAKSGDCSMSVSDSKIQIVGGDVEMMFSLMNEKFPNIKPVIFPPEKERQATIGVDRDELIQALRVCSAMGADTAKFVTLKCSKSEIMISAESGENTNQLSDKVPCKCTKAVTFGVSSVQLPSAIEGMETDKDGNIKLELYPNLLLAVNGNRISFVSLRVPETK